MFSFVPEILNAKKCKNANLRGNKVLRLFSSRLALTQREPSRKEEWKLN